jgi:hypothetical protein
MKIADFIQQGRQLYGQCLPCKRHKPIVLGTLWPVEMLEVRATETAISANSPLSPLSHLPVRLRQRKRQALRMRVNPSCRGSACIFCLIRMSRARCAIRVSRLKDRSGSLQHRCGGFE